MRICVSMSRCHLSVSAAGLANNDRSTAASASTHTQRERERERERYTYRIYKLSASFRFSTVTHFQPGISRCRSPAFKDTLPGSLWSPPPSVLQDLQKTKGKPKCDAQHVSCVSGRSKNIKHLTHTHTHGLCSPHRHALGGMITYCKKDRQERVGESETDNRPFFSPARSLASPQSLLRRDS